MKENAGHKYQSHILHKEENQSKKFKISDCSGGKCSEMHLNCNLGFFFFFFFFFSPSLKGWYEFISSSSKFYVYESAILKIFKDNALVWTWLFTCFLCTMQETQTVSNLAVRTSVPHCLLKMSHLVTLAHTCHLLVRHQRNQVCAVKWLFIFFFLSMVGFWLVFFSCLFYQ